MGKILAYFSFINNLRHSDSESVDTSRRRFIRAALGLSGLMLAGPLVLEGCSGHFIRHRRPRKTKYDTVAHEMLDIELEHKGDPACYLILDSIIDVAKELIQPKASDRIAERQSATTVLSTIGKILDAHHFEYQKNALLTIALNTRKIDCDGYSFIYLAIGEALGLPIRMVRAPAHTFVRWHRSETEYINWETTIQVPKNNDYYIHTHKIDANANGISVMRSLDVHRDRAQILANAYTNCGVAWFGKMRFNTAIERFDEAIERDPFYEAPYYNKGLAHYYLGDMQNAILWCEKAVALNPNHMRSHAVLGTAYQEIKNREKARIHFKRVQELDPEYYVSKIMEMRLSDSEVIPEDRNSI